MRSPLLPAAAIVGIATAVIGASSAVPIAQAQTRITVPGAGPLYYPTVITNLPLGRFYLLGTREAGGQPLSILEGYDVLNHMIGENWFSSSTPQVVNYPASIGLLSGSLSAPGTNDGVEMGRRSLDDQIKNAANGGNPVVIAALSEGTIVINRELAHLATDPKAPPAGSLSFVLFSSPETGLANTYWPDGVTVPLINYAPQSVPDSQYDVSVVFSQYDAWADPPDRPWNLVSVVNSLFGTAYFHNTAAMAELDDTVEVSSVKGELGGTTTTRMVPSSTVPLLKPLDDIGVPDEIVDALNSRLKPIVDAGYSRLTPDAGPHFSHGQLVGLPSAVLSQTDRTAEERSGATVRNSDIARVVESAARALRTPARVDADHRSDGRPRAALRHVVDGVTKRLTELADKVSNRHSRRDGESSGTQSSSGSISSGEKGP